METCIFPLFDVFSFFHNSRFCNKLSASFPEDSVHLHRRPAPVLYRWIAGVRATTR